MSTPSLYRVPLAFPSLLNLAALTAEADAPRSWIQLAKTGAFQSNRYGKFSITRDDLTQMLSNFRNVTPKAPTELPIDYDHLSMDPKKPGDGVAAGWLKAVELRADGEELWGEVEWTPEAADLIRKRAYKFVSPSFVKDHVHKDGRKIGTTLLAAAITNHPFLEQMSALTLYNFSALGDLALNVAQDDVPTSLHLSEVGQVVTFREDAEATPELTPTERGQVFRVKAVRGVGDEAFAKLESLTGEPYGWYPVTAFAPGNAPDMRNISPLPNQTEVQMSDTIKAAARFAAAVKQFEAGGTPTYKAIQLAQDRDKDGAEAYRLHGVGSDTLPEAVPGPVLSLSTQPQAGESFDDVVGRYVAEHRVPLREAIHAVGRARPDLAAAR